MKIYKATAKKREKQGKSVNELREQGIIPAVVYGPELEQSINIQMPVNEIEKLYREAGESSLISLQIEGEAEPFETLIKDIDYDPVLMSLRHVDFYKIKRGHKIETVVEIDFVGEPPAVKELGGTFVTPMTEVRIKCLPKDLVSEITVDVSGLKTFDDVISVKDLGLSEDIEILEDETSPVAFVEEIRIEEVPTEAPEADMPEVEGEAAEGEVAEGGDKSDGDEAEKKAEEANEQE